MGPWMQIISILLESDQAGVRLEDFCRQMPDVKRELIVLLLSVGVRNKKLDVNYGYYSFSLGWLK